MCWKHPASASESILCKLGLDKSKLNFTWQNLPHNQKKTKPVGARQTINHGFRATTCAHGFYFRFKKQFLQAISICYEKYKINTAWPTSNFVKSCYYESSCKNLRLARRTLKTYCIFSTNQKMQYFLKKSI